MAVLWVRSGYADGLDRKINKYNEKLGSISGLYNEVNSKISSYTNDSNVINCNIYLKKRRSQLQASVDAANSLKKKAHNYVNTVTADDVALSSSIHDTSYSYYNKKGIGPKSDSFASRAWNSIKTTAQDFIHDAGEVTKRIVSDIKELYEEYKYIFNILGDILMVAAAVALFSFASLTGVGLIILIGATWALGKALYETATDCMALDAWANGDEERAEDLSNRTLTGDIIKAGEWLDNKLGKNFIEDIFKAITIGLDVCELFGTVATIFLSVEKILNLDSLKSLDIRNIHQHSFKKSLYYGRGIPKRIMKSFLSDPSGVIKGLIKQGNILIKEGKNLGQTIGNIILA